MTLPEIRKRLRFWKKELNLQHWKFSIRVPKDGELPDAHAQIEPLGEHDRCRLIIREGEYAEFFLVHELVHLVVDKLTTEASKAADHLEEVAVNRMARALCNAYKIACPPWKVITGEDAARQ